MSSSSKHKLKEDFGLKYDTLDIGQRIRDLRQKKKWSMHRLSYEACIDSAVLMRIEKGIRAPVLDTLLKIIEGLGLRPAEFFRVFK
ncbi:transcriptional regulator XRE family [Candidatus Termititenax aidoneus]|uniref:Transcriptional regulator XRE family n=1 Tax=Termititenax aidoneus TaxID=2218524 RepID=A0A388TA33_TERA1|nr:transcriptional regulator XRE family [Candidatus Termititenax aidoneus]